MRELRQLSSPSNELWNRHHGILVVGSGYGGAIAASRLARATPKQPTNPKPSVTLIERGREIHPGDFPATTHDARAQLQISDSGELGRLSSDRSGLYWLHVGPNMHVFSGCGLGGSSLINANVSIEPDPKVFEDRCWPEQLRHDLETLPQGDPGSLKTGFGLARQMLQPIKYPDSYPPLNKVGALRRAAGGPVAMADINVRFQGGPNAVGIEQAPCTCCGDCVAGCNVGAKNTLLMNYLPDAVDHGATVFTQIDVDRIERASDGTWIVWARDLSEDPHESAPARKITSDIVVLAGGTMGSTGILLRSRDKLALSPALGRHFTGNGDVLGFATDCQAEIDGVGDGPDRTDPTRLAGPCITAIIDKRPGQPLNEAMIIEDAAIPGAISRIVWPVLAGESLDRWGRHLRRGRWTNPAFLDSLLHHGARGALRHTATYLLIGHDEDPPPGRRHDGGAIELDPDGNPVVKWRDAGKYPHYRRANNVLTEASTNVGGQYLPSPLWTKALKHSLITVHPLGGCAMADRVEHGVVDHAGQVFDPTSKDEVPVHKGLYIWDGSIVPRSLGVNPLLTIAALAERGVALMAAAHEWTIDDSLPPPAPVVPDPKFPPQVPSLRFTESLSGFWSPTAVGGVVPATFEHAADEGRGAGRTITFTITVTAEDLRKVIAEPATKMGVRGTLSITDPDVPQTDLGDMAFAGGELQLFVPLRDAPHHSHMIYGLPVTAPDGQQYFVSGFKVIQPGALGDVWPGTTTLYVNIHRDDVQGPVIGLGVMTLSTEDFAQQLRTMKVAGALSHIEGLELLARFGEMFGGRLFRDYGHIVHPSTKMKPHAPPRKRRRLEVPPAEIHRFRTEDGVDLRLTRYNGGTPRRGGPLATVVLSHGMGANPLTFTIDTIRPNLVEVLVKRGCDVWLQEWRGSTLLPSSDTMSFNADPVALYDHPATQAKVQEITGIQAIHWITHCVGTMTALMSILRGRLRPASLVCSSAGAQPVASPAIRLKTRIHLAELLRVVGIKRLTTDSYDNEALWERAFDRAVRLNWIPEEERCDQAVCHRLAFIYGVATHHDAIDEITHLALHELFGVVNTEMLVHLSECARQKKLVDGEGHDLFGPNIDRLNFPITFLHGAKNLVWLPQSSEETINQLRARFPKDALRYARYLFQDFGHQDLIMGADAWEHSFPRIVEHLEKWALAPAAQPSRAAPSSRPPAVPSPPGESPLPQTPRHR